MSTTNNGVPDPPDYYNYPKELLHQIPENQLELFEHQVAGHGSAEKGLLKTSTHILKPLQPHPKGQREIDFYIKVQSSPIYSSLKDFTPEFHGITVINNQHYIMLQDILHGLSKPCVVDIKIGSVTWSPDASESKIKQEMSKYKGTKSTLGLCMTGMRYYEMGSGRKVVMTRDEGKGLDVEGFRVALERYFNVRCGGVVMDRVVRDVVSKLEEIERVFQRNNSFRLYGSSVLIAYDLEGVAGMMVGGGEGADVRVYLIDFAHYHEVDGGGVDENYLFGVGSLLRVVKGIIGDK